MDIDKHLSKGKVSPVSYLPLTAMVLSFVVLPITVQAATYQTYVIDTYGGDLLLTAVRQQLNTSPNGGNVSNYQDKLVLRTTPANYQAVLQLLSQIDSQPQPLTVAVRVGSNSKVQRNTQQGRVIISNRGIQGTGVIMQRGGQQQSDNLYQVQTLSGSAASISTGTLYALTQNYSRSVYSNYSNNNRPLGQIVIQQQVLLPTTQGIAVVPRLLPSGQVEVSLSQVEETLLRSNTTYRQNNAVKAQRLNSTIIVPRGQWVTIGQITQNGQSQSSGYGINRTIDNSNSVPISLLVQ
ncbi:hypothetical protein [Psychrobacter sp. DM4]|uniref:hypothetical protein n=1 Tax=Psychrobacter sp. DM4 TaxID=3440637 RepID=UPI003F50C69E